MVIPTPKNIWATIRGYILHIIFIHYITYNIYILHVCVCACVSIADIFRVRGKVMNFRGRCEEDMRGIGGGG